VVPPDLPQAEKPVIISGIKKATSNFFISCSSSPKNISTPQGVESGPRLNP
jgi:hypothetical protein